MFGAISHLIDPQHVVFSETTNEVAFFVVEIVLASLARVNSLELSCDGSRLLNQASVARRKTIFEVRLVDASVLSDHNSFSMRQSFLVVLALVDELAIFCPD